MKHDHLRSMLVDQLAFSLFDGCGQSSTKAVNMTEWGIHVSMCERETAWEIPFATE